ncbi:MAG: IPExxxVDY family protein [Bacteroidota bacterium]
MKKTRLEIDYGYDFSLVGVACILKPHRLAWELNRRMELQLMRIPDHQVPERTGDIANYTCFLHRTDITSIRLFRNRSNDEGASKWLLVPEHPRFDYILMYTSKEEDKGPLILGALKNIPTIELSAFLPLASLKSKENLIT